MRYAFIAENRLIFAVRAMCRMLLVHPSGFYAWLREPFSPRAVEDKRQTVLLKQAWDDSGEVYGYRKLHDDLCDLGEDISPNRAWRLARLAGIRAQIGYKKKPGSYGGSPAVVADNTLNREFDVHAPDQFWVTDITYIRTHEGFLYLAVVIDLFSRRVIGWSMQGRTYTDLPLQALLMAVWRRKPKAKVHVHSDQGSQFTGYEWQEFLEQHNLVPSMSRRGNCWDNAVVETLSDRASATLGASWMREQAERKDSVSLNASADLSLGGESSASFSAEASFEDGRYRSADLRIDVAITREDRELAFFSTRCLGEYASTSIGIPKFDS